MKKNYQKPTMSEVKIQFETILQASVEDINSNTTMHYGGGGSGPARGRERNTFDDWEE